MKNLITFLICLLSVTVFAANPTYNSFLPADFTNNGNTIGLNPASPKFVGTNGVNTNGNYVWTGLNSFSNPTNIFVGSVSLYNLTNQLGQQMGYLRTIITTNSTKNTNQFNLSGAGAAVYNLSYNWNNTIGAWTNITGYVVGLVPINGAHEAMPAPFDNSGSAVSCYTDEGTGLTDMQAVWIQANVCGLNPQPTGFFTTNYTYTTNSIYVLTNLVNITRFESNVVYLDEINGNDITALPGVRWLPFKTSDQARAAMEPGKTLVVLSGNPTNTTGNLNIVDNVSITGIGRGVSTFPKVYLRGSAKLANATFGVLNVTSTNATITASSITSDSDATSSGSTGDCWYIGDTTTGLRINSYDSSYITTWDAWADTSGQTRPNATIANNEARFYNCDFINPYTTTGSIPDIIILGPSKFYMYGGSVISKVQNINGNCLVMTDPAWKGGTNGYAEFHNVHFVNENNLGSNWIIFNAMGADIKLFSCTANTNLIYDPSNKVRFINVPLQ